MTAPIVRERCEASARAAAWGVQPSRLAAAVTLLHRSWSTLLLPFNTRDTVAIETRAACATSRTVTVLALGRGRRFFGWDLTNDFLRGNGRYPAQSTSLTSPLNSIGQ